MSSLKPKTLGIKPPCPTELNNISMWLNSQHKPGTITIVHRTNNNLAWGITFVINILRPIQFTRQNKIKVRSQCQIQNQKLASISNPDGEIVLKYKQAW
jgi:hypothetical protein